jgi:hypothetical protein
MESYYIDTLVNHELDGERAVKTSGKERNCLHIHPSGRRLPDHMPAVGANRPDAYIPIYRA